MRERRSRRVSRRKQSRRLRSRRKHGRRGKSRVKKSRKSRISEKSRKSGKCEQKWKTLEHNGVMFQEEYVPIGIPITYEDQNGNKLEIELTPHAEEAAFFYARVCMIKDQNYTKNKTFNSNFWNDFKKLLPKGSLIKKFSGLSFENFVKYTKTKKDLQGNISRSRKRYEKDQKELKYAPFKTAYVDGKPQDVGNFIIEPASIFMGRGKHPKMGMIKTRIQPKDVTINIGASASIPKLPAGQFWGHIIHDPCKEWLASWKDPISGSVKYVYLAPTADFKSQSDEAKFNLARDLKQNFIQAIRQNYMDILDSVGIGKAFTKRKQLATALYLIDSLLLRVGNEKSSDEADTVGVTSLRVEHIKLGANPPPYKIALDFLGKDSVRYEKKLEVPKSVYQELKLCEKGKEPKDLLFDLITPKDVNYYLKNFMPGLTAKVFRTMNASTIYQNSVDKIKISRNEKIPTVVNKVNKANADVAIACNHTKKVSSTFNEGIRKITSQISKTQQSIKEKQSEINHSRDRKSRRKSQGLITKLSKEKEKLKDLRVKLDAKRKLKSVATGTSKQNYIDPRITVAFSKRKSIPLEKLFNKQQLKKFEWAEDVKSNWKF
jgi:DNA topoisomerase I